MENNELLQITGTVEDIIYRNQENGYTVLEMDVQGELITATGIMPSLESGMEAKLFGHYKSHPSYGLQFSVETFEQTIPTSAHGILKYLSSGAVKGIGVTTATTLVKAFGENTLKVMSEEPERVAKLRGISQVRAQDFAKQLKENIGVRELMLYLSEFSITPNTAVKIYNIYGNKSLEYIKENPYSLCQSGIRVTFEIADMIAVKQGKQVDDEFRIRAGIVHVLSHNKVNGHTCLPEERLVKTTSSFLNVEQNLVQASLNDMIFDASLMREVFDEKKFVFLPEMHRAESFIAGRIKLMQSFPASKFKNTDKLIEKIEQEE